MAKEEMRNFLIKKFEIDETTDGMEWYINNVVNGLDLIVNNDELAKLIISDFYLLSMKREIVREREAKLKALEVEAAKAEAEAAKAEAEHCSFEETMKDIDKSLGNTIANLDAIISMLK